MKLWNRDFTMVVIGQIISLFGNAILRFALPLYLLNQTNSPALFGLVSACAFIPMIVLSPIGGIFADRINKRNIMVILDFSTAAVVLLLSVLLGKVNLVLLLLVVMILLYGIQGAYQPSVQASIPALLSSENIMQGNAVINLVSSVSGLIGPVIGGSLFSFFGIMPILYVSAICFLTSAIMEIFIHIPYAKKEATGNIFSIGYRDLKDSFLYMSKDEPLILRVSFIVASLNLFLSSFIIIGLPILITQKLGFTPDMGNRFFGYAEGFLAIGSLVGGVLAGVLSKKLKPQNSYSSIFYSALALIPIGFAIAFPINTIACYIIIVLSCFVVTLFAALFSVQTMSYLQMIVPSDLMGKVVSCAMCIGMCAAPLGQALYGGLFQLLKDNLYIIAFITAIISGTIALLSKNTFAQMAAVLERNRF